ncbi:urease accessory protein UreF [Halodurantibacterium flavum]|uniref:Urease accessory protein UreF n=1 Tax=Halodurantibacterium flavum TaxID=1382802 RepID=A0ABW4S3S1_9RHOB
MTDPLLTLVQWLSPAFPVGGYAYSHGLETVIARQEIRTAAGLSDWLSAILRWGAARTDAILLAHALAPGQDIMALAETAKALAPSQERLLETMEQGRAFLATTNALTGQKWPPMPYPVAVGAAAAGLGVASEQVLRLYLHAFASNLVQGAVRFVPMGQTDGQAVLQGLHGAIAEVAAEAVDAPLSALGAGVLRADLAAMQHETMDVRIFRT